jgi:hypothetical protein
MSDTIRVAISPEQRRKMLRKAKSLHKKAEELLSDLIDLVGPEHASTDYADNVVVATEEMVDVMRKKSYDMWNPVVPVSKKAAP